MLCERYGQLPSAIDAEDTYLHRMIAIVGAGGKFDRRDASGGAAPPEPEAGADADLAALTETLG